MCILLFKREKDPPHCLIFLNIVFLIGGFPTYKLALAGIFISFKTHLRGDAVVSWVRVSWCSSKGLMAEAVGSGCGSGAASEWSRTWLPRSAHQHFHQCSVHTKLSGFNCHIRSTYRHAKRHTNTKMKKRRADSLDRGLP